MPEVQLFKKDDQVSTSATTGTSSTVSSIAHFYLTIDHDTFGLQQKATASTTREL